MIPIPSAGQPLGMTPTNAIRDQLERLVEQLIASLPSVDNLSADQQRRMIARYSSVLEGNFVYWMTGASLAAKSREAQAIIRENLLEEVRDCHPGMLRRFSIAAGAVPSHEDAQMVYQSLTKVRLFIGTLSPVPLLAMMAFFESYIQRFMPYLAELAKRRGSTEFEYTNVHSACDGDHSDALLRALDAEIALLPTPPENLLEGVALLQTLLSDIVTPCPLAKSAAAVN
jgi:hypothetical protein